MLLFLVGFSERIIASMSGMRVADIALFRAKQSASVPKSQGKKAIIPSEYFLSQSTISTRLAFLANFLPPSRDLVLQFFYVNGTQKTYHPHSEYFQLDLASYKKALKPELNFLYSDYEREEGRRFSVQLTADLAGDYNEVEIAKHNKDPELVKAFHELEAPCRAIRSTRNFFNNLSAESRNQQGLAPLHPNFFGLDFFVKNNQTPSECFFVLHAVDPKARGLTLAEIFPLTGTRMTQSQIFKIAQILKPDLNPSKPPLKQAMRPYTEEIAHFLEGLRVMAARYTSRELFAEIKQQHFAKSQELLKRSQ